MLRCNVRSVIANIVNQKGKLHIICGITNRRKCKLVKRNRRKTTKDRTSNQRIPIL